MHEVSAQNYQDVKVGNVYSFTRTITQDDAFKFAELNGDYNPLHLDETYGRESKFGKNVVHGMLTASLFSTLIGMYCPGKNSLYLSQTIQFKMPLFYGETVEARATIMNKTNVTKILNLKPTDLLSSKSIKIFKAESPPPQQNRRQVQLVTLVVPGEHQHQQVDVEAQVYFE